MFYELFHKQQRRRGDTMHSEQRKECLHVQGKVTTNTKHAFGMYDDIS